MLNSYLNQKAQYTPALRDGDSLVMDDRGTVQYGPVVAVPCRCQPKTQEVLTADKQVIQTAMIYYLEQCVAVGDLLDGKRVELVTGWVTLGGTVLGYKAAC